MIHCDFVQVVSPITFKVISQAVGVIYVIALLLTADIMCNTFTIAVLADEASEH